MMRRISRRGVGFSGGVSWPALFLALFVLPTLVAHGAAPLRILQPAHLSSLEPTPIRVLLPQELAGPLPYTLTLTDEGDQVGHVVRGTLLPGTDPRVATLLLDPAELAAFSLGEAVVLDLAVDGGGMGREARAEATLLPEPASAEASSWAITFSGRPAQLYTTKDSALPLVATNPKASAKNAQIKVMFLDAKNKKKGQVIVPATLNPGANEGQVGVAAVLASTVKGAGCANAKAVLVVGGIVRATETVPVDYDLLGEGSASPTSGMVPLTAAFEGSASGGTPPYTYAWDFGDGSTGTGPSPVHTYPNAGTFFWSLVVTDAVNGLVGATGSVTAEPRPHHTLTVSVGSGATGTPAAGTYDFVHGDAVPYAYSAAACYENLAVTLDGAGVPASGTLIMDADHAISVTATLKTFTITATAGAGGSISPAGASGVPCGGSQGYTITANPSYFVQDVRVDGSSVGAAGSYTFTGVVANHTIAATFSQVPNHTLTVSVSPGVGGTPAGTTTYPQGTVVPYAYALNDACYENLAVTLDGSPVAPSGSVTMDRPHTLSADASLKAFLIAASAGAGGSISPPDKTSVPCGGSQTYTITPSFRYYVAEVLVDGVSVGVVASYTFSDVRSDHAIAATFLAVPSYTLTATLTAGVAGKPSGTAGHPQGTVVEYGYALSGTDYENLVVTLDGTPVPHTGLVTMNGDHALAASATPVGQATPAVARPQ